jgi:urease beta subunit
MAQHAMFNNQMGVPMNQMTPAQAAHMAAMGGRRMPVASPFHLQQAQLAQQHQQQGQPMNVRQPRPHWSF